jgi:hypothetical protein
MALPARVLARRDTAQLVCRVVALVRGELAQHKVKVVGSEIGE